MDGQVTSSLSNGIAELQFSHPKGNSLPGVMLADLAREISVIGSDPSVKVIILSSKGTGAFCGGASFDELISIADEKSGKEFFMGFARVMLAMIKAPVFVITKVQGKAVGGGTGIIAASDYAIAHKNASIKLSELNLGIGPFVIGPVLEHKIGAAQVLAMSIDRNWRSADWALEQGLFHQLVTDHAELDSTVQALAVDLSTKNPEAMTAIKRSHQLRIKDLEQLLEEKAALSGKLVLSDFTRKFILAFKDKN